MSYPVAGNVKTYRSPDYDPDHAIVVCATVFFLLNVIVQINIEHNNKLEELATKKGDLIVQFNEDKETNYTL